jgi:hypothetical protein
MPIPPNVKGAPNELKVSVHPTKGSLWVDPTIDGLTIQVGRVPLLFNIVFSANDFVKVYVFGYPSNIVFKFSFIYIGFIFKN